MSSAEISAFAVADKTRQDGLFSVLDPVDEKSIACVGAVRVSGKDATRFLHAQLTNEVNALRPGEGNLTARLSRTGHLLQILSLFRLPESGDADPSFLLIMERRAVAPLLEELRRFLFADEVTFADDSSAFSWATIQGPGARSTLQNALAKKIDIQENGVVELAGADLPHGTLLVSHLITGDEAFLLALPKTASSNDLFLTKLEATARRLDLACPSPEITEAVLDILRIEAGNVRVGVDTPGRDRLLPETRMERQLVSYDKGCFIGQEVIARVRTYGSLPYELRGLVLEAEDPSAVSLNEMLESLPAVGEMLRIEDGKKIGQIVSRTLSPVMNAPVALAYLHRDHRTPGKELLLESDLGQLKAKVMLLPFCRSS